ncbi:hypothetical protein CSB45_00315 [candidate division KSB3 bacterium]|uniref:Peptidase C14 caspase domain-containing protein n=1 Tax=candidate division KSB3 bacterium TaxID=2044937 RepID=A0A2G6EE72_9BACT|nr:MAG: hypothetical protein CSB45_00315 [candidate division KSB3 bacterium]PIE28387.1 MAG: hypothetical protein CSA57_14165 [candidate division KSB3 bacterium]
MKSSLLLSSLICVLGILTFSPQAAASRWYEYYREAQRASQNKQWEKAIEFYQKAIQNEPEPSARRKYGMKRIRYFPYLEMGIAYIGAGDIQAAYDACTQSHEKGAAPRKDIERCIAVTSKYLSSLHGSLDQDAADPSPSVTITTELPSRIREHTFDIKGIAKSASGIQQVKLSVTNLGITAVSSFEMQQGRQENFWITVPVDFGQNDILLEAIDSDGQTARQEFTVFREPSEGSAQQNTADKPQLPLPEPTPAPEHDILPAVSPIPVIPRPEPTPIVAENTPPDISIISEIPRETIAETFLLRGIASDPDGVEDVQISLKQVGSRGLEIATQQEQQPSSDRSQYNFERHLPLTPGKNQILIEAFDVNGLRSQRLLEIIRTSPAPQQADDVAQTDLQRPGKIYAVIIGIGQYEDSRLNLRYTVNDAQGLYDLLTDPVYGGVPQENIKLLLNEHATDRAIKGAIGKWLGHHAKEDDTVIIYYSGHGAPEGKETYWVTYNANIDDLYTTALNNKEIADMLSRVSARRMITFLDSCYSAATVNRKNQTRAAPAGIPWEEFHGEGRVTISASDGKQLSLELEEYKHGVFTYYLLEGLKGQADNNQDAVVDVDEIWDYVKNKVTERARQEGYPQTPVIQGEHSAGIPLTYNMRRIREAQQNYIKEKQAAKLATLFAEQQIDAEHFECALSMLDAGTPNRWLSQLLAGEIKVSTFRRFFTCE